MRIKRNDLQAAVERLEHALSEPGADHAARLREPLARLEDVVWQKIAALKPADGKLIDVDRPRLPSPAVDRRADKLCTELEKFLEEVRALRGKARQTAAAAPVSDPATLAGALPVAPEAGADADLGVLLQRARQLLQDMEHYEAQEAELIYDSVNTDIGAGD